MTVWDAEVLRDAPMTMQTRSKVEKTEVGALNCKGRQCGSHNIISVVRMAQTQSPHAQTNKIMTTSHWKPQWRLLMWCYQHLHVTFLFSNCVVFAARTTEIRFSLTALLPTSIRIRTTKTYHRKLWTRLLRQNNNSFVIRILGYTYMILNK